MKNESIIEKNNHFKGDLKVSGDLQISGIAEGNIEVENCIKVDGGRVMGNVKARCAIINGNVDGEIQCEKYIEVNNGVVNARLKSPKIIISEFAEYPDLSKIIIDK